MFAKPIGIAAAAVVIVAAVAVVSWPGVGVEIALADVHQKLSEVSVVAFRMQGRRPGAPALDAQAYVNQDSKLRMETKEQITVIDWSAGRIAVLDLKQRQAIVGDVANIASNPYQRDWLDGLRRIVGHRDARSVGRRDIDGVESAGWQVTDEGYDVTVWADAASAELVKVDFVRGDSTLSFTRFRYDVEIDASKFEPQAPAGYQVRQVNIDARAAGEADVVALLRIWAMGNDGVFPDVLDAAKFNDAAQRVNWREVPNIEQANETVGRAFWWLYSSAGWTYAGKAVKLGDADTPVFWHQPEGQADYRVIYGDLHVETSANAPAR